MGDISILRRALVAPRSSTDSTAPHTEPRLILRSRAAIDPAGARARLDALQATVHREAEGTEVDPFDDAAMAAVAGVTEASKAEAGALAVGETGAVKMGRKVPR